MKYRIGFDDQRKLVSVSFFEFLDAETGQRYTTELSDGLRARQGRGHYNLLITVGQQDIMPQGTVEAINDLVESEAFRIIRKTAVVSHSALHAMQVKRIGENRLIRPVATEKEAMDWFAGEEGPE
ncbi:MULTISPECIES: hypothetical protein [Sphingobium]|uniref:STAS/SEC14 domain-containing protein n=1 Tax=Sphingobium fuliginis (strain ATCC 27551) TaxID=336203 RepID=A0ABQ1EZU7_SPHSA|nr:MULTISPECIES: hypothetical protein [Sphingobium]AJR25107.1 hypothetical protein TZ53_16605 [Sphingobium sp. YBL2]RYL97528.1 hypothetical protein EWH10_13335 [Sphingobium fuliginis]WDA37369.1 hypothetical protein PO876_03975 [Sphingobium sp. YC-XJ3]GFZ94913.1 hypothetical protein GCM10019071_26610 [Sphingobium fuliginis]